MALNKIGLHSKTIEITLVNGEEYGILINEEVISCGHYKGNDEFKEIIIPNGIKTICSEAFLDCTSLTTITLPESLHRIDIDAFVGCTALQKIILPTSLDEVECWLDGSGVSKMTLSQPSSDELIKHLKEGYAVDLYYKGEFRDDHWD